MVIRFSQDPEATSGWEPLPRGTYAVEFHSYEENTSGNGNPQINLKGQVVEGPHTGKKVSIWYTFTAKAAWRFRELCEKLGVALQHEGKDAEGNDLFAADPEALMGRVALFDVSVRKDDQGREQNDYNKPRAHGAPAQPAGGYHAPQGYAAPGAPQGFQPPPGAPAPMQQAPQQQYGAPPQGYQPPQQQQQQYAPPQGAPAPQGYVPQGAPPASYAAPPYGGALPGPQGAPGAPPPDRRPRNG